MNRKILHLISPFSVLSRSKGYKAPGGIRYPGGIVYYPRNPETHLDPEYTPTKLFRVERIKSSKHFPWWQKKILQDLMINEEERVAIVKNIPENNMRLWKVKHLIKVTPITFPYGEPTEEDIKYTVLKENGQCLVTKTLMPQENCIEALDEFDMDAKKMDSTTIKRDSRHKWNNAFTGGF
ncbi:large ribosomal subunit protein uL30m [Amyelois transitella]|uniref:large ribosomal subunit protein uL30m n=1 Tax=Amyelois transitella TaxID=680683 RepID=UPI00298FA2FE|nr:large ribosomal subunit protein uL30m [Amyelois transitella]